MVVEVMSCRRGGGKGVAVNGRNPSLGFFQYFSLDPDGNSDFSEEFSIL